MELMPYIVEERKDTGLFNAKLGIWLFLSSEVMLFGALFSSYVLLRTGGGAHWPHGSSILNVPIGAFNTAVLIASSVTMVFSWAALKENNLKKFKLNLALTILCAFTFLFVKAYEYGQKFGEEHIHPAVFLNAYSFLWTSYVNSLLHSGWGTKIISGASTLALGFLIFKKFKTALKFICGGLFLSFVLMTIFEFGSRTSHHYYPPSHNTFMAIYFTLTGLHALHVIGGIIVNGYLLGPGNKLWQTDPQRFTNRIEIAGIYWHFVDLVWIFLFPVLYLL